MLLWTIDIELLEIGVAIEEFLMIGDAVILDPIVGPNKAIGKPAREPSSCRLGSRSREIHRAREQAIHLPLHRLM